jgi:hypothetical protein
VDKTTVKRLICGGFRRTGKAMGQLYQCWWRICREINVFPMLEYRMFYVLCFMSVCALFTDSPSYVKVKAQNAFLPMFADAPIHIMQK